MKDEFHLAYAFNYPKKLHYVLLYVNHRPFDVPSKFAIRYPMLKRKNLLPSLTFSSFLEQAKDNAEIEKNISLDIILIYG